MAKETRPVTLIRSGPPNTVYTWLLALALLTPLSASALLSEPSTRLEEPSIRLRPCSRSKAGKVLKASM